MPYVIRGERIGDEDAIDVVNTRAFESADEPYLVRNLRTYYPMFDSRYSVTAWHGDEMVGHTLFTPAQLRLMGETVSALAVGPVAVVPEHQRKGVGGQMLRYGHDLGRREGYVLSFLLGHPPYYPQHGYKACYGFAQIRLEPKLLPSPAMGLDPWPVRPEDLPWLEERNAAEWSNVDMGWLWGAGLAEWTMAGVNALVWHTPGGRRVAYTVSLRRDVLGLVLAEDEAMAREVIARLRPTVIKQHPSGWLAQNAIDPAWGRTKVARSDAAMVCELQSGVLGPYLEALEAGTRLPGHCNYPLAFALCDRE